jgi:hypothetical protein
MDASTLNRQLETYLRVHAFPVGIRARGGPSGEGEGPVEAPLYLRYQAEYPKPYQEPEKLREQEKKR